MSYELRVTSYELRVTSYVLRITNYKLQIKKMKILEESTKFAHLGKPGTAFSKGFQRRLDIISKLVDFKDKKILDLGCGEGVWLEAFSKFTAYENLYGSDIDKASIDIAFSENRQLKKENLVVCPAEILNFPDNFFDIVFQNEVLEHVEDDVKTIQECLRVLKPGGKIILFTPNRGWPFETHGMFLNGKYYWGNIPLLPWLPKFISKKFAPHVRNYSNKELKSVISQASEISNLKSKIQHHSHVFSGFDGAVRKFGILGKILQKFFHLLEKTPFHFFGISHLMVVEKK